MQKKRQQRFFFVALFFFVTLISSSLISLAIEGGDDDSPEADETDVIAVSAAEESELPANVALHRWDFDDESDRLGHATVTGNRSYNTGGTITFAPSDTTGGYAAVFNGESGIFLGSDLINMTTYTISFWLNPATITAFTPAFWAVNESPTQWMSILPEAWWGGSGVWMYGPWQDIDPNRMYRMTVGEWHHLVVTVDTGRVTVYLDNQVIAESPSINNLFGRGDAEFFLGVNRWDTPFNGMIDEVRLYNNAALTPAGVEALFNLEDPALADFIVPAPVDVTHWIVPGANRDFADRPAPDFQNATVHDPAMTRTSITRPDGDWYYIIGTFLGAARTQDFVQFEPIDYGLGYPNLRNTHGHRFMPVDNSDPAVQTFEEQVRSVRSDGGGNPPRRTDGAFTPGTIDDLVIWASDIIEVPNVDGEGSRFFQYYSFSHWGVPDSAIGLAIADTMDGPWVTQGLVVRSRHGNNNHAMDGTPFIRNYHPNAIDPYPIFCSEGRFWLVYGSWEGGVYIAELDPATGLFLEGSEINQERNGYGRKLIASNSNQIEGAHMIYSPTTNMYYLFASWGSLASYNGYNVRMFRSERPYGPFEDARFRQFDVEQNQTSGQNRIDITGEVFHHTNDSGVKIIGGYRFVGTEAEDSLGRGYLSPGHGSMNWDPINERYMKIFHTRFVGGGESHQIRAHEMFMNENDWFLMAPLRFDGVGGTQGFYPEDLVGDYKILSHGRGTNTTATQSNVYRFNEVGNIVATDDNVVGTWRLIDDYVARINFRGLTYTGLFLRQFCDDTSNWVQTFTVLSYDEQFLDDADVTTFRGASTAGIALWGVGVSAGIAFEGEVDFQDDPIMTPPPPVLTPVVPERNADGAIVWNFDDSFDGGIPVGIAPGFDPMIQPSNRRPDDTLTFVEDRHGNADGALRFGGNAGGSGLYLGEGIIDTANYTIAFWVRPENVAPSFTSLFFGAVADDDWISLHPASGLRGNAGTLAFWSGSGAGRWSDNLADGNLANHEWQHVAAVVSGNTVTLFLNGTPLSMQRLGPYQLREIFSTHTDRIFLGLNFFPDPIFTGAIDDLHIFNRSLTARQVLELYDPGFEPGDEPAIPPVVPELVAGALYWSFDEDLGGASAVRTREELSAVDLTLMGTVPLEPGRIGNAAHFTGTSGLYLGDNLITGDTYTITFWANPSTITTWTSMFFGGNTARHLSITARMGGGSSAAFTVPGHTWYFVPGVIPVDEWTHFAFTTNGSTASLYINGQRVHTESNPTNVFGSMSNGQFFLGLNYWDTAFRGLIDEVYIFPTSALTTAEIRELADVHAEGYIRPGANVDDIDPVNPVFVETTIHDPSLTRGRAADGWFYATGTDLGASRTRDFMAWEAINYGIGYPQIGNPPQGSGGRHHAFFPVDNPDPSIQTMEQQIKYVGAHPPGSERAIFWASEIIEVDGRYFHYYSLAGGIGEWNLGGSLGGTHPQAGIGLAIADNIDGPWVTQGLFLRSGFGNRYLDSERVPFNTPSGTNMTMSGEVPFDARIHPNTIDASPFICKDGELWLVYGSYSGGIFLFEMDRETGLPKPDSAINQENDGYGRLLIALTHHQGEGPHMIYSETSGYYYLFLTYGWLASYGGYNVRMWRSENPYGPFEDARFGQMHVQANPFQTGHAARWVDVDGSEFTHDQMGNKMIGGYQFISADIEEAASIAYQSPGHGGLIYYEGRYLKIFHTRFTGRWEWHQVRVHETFMNCEGWFVMAPLRFDGGEGARSFAKEDLVGDFKILHHGRETNTTPITSSLYRLKGDGVITDAVGNSVGTWRLDGENIANIMLYDINYNGVFLRQFDNASGEWVQTFTALSYDRETPRGADSTAGLTIWGKGISAGDSYSGIPTVRHTVVFDRNDGSENTFISEELVLEGLLISNIPEDLSREGYIFGGWTLDAEGTIPFDPDAPVTGNKTIYAQWREESVDPCPIRGRFVNQSAAQGGLTGSEWRLCKDGTLEIDEGFINWNVYLGPWHTYRESITRVVINGPITAGTALRSLFRDFTNATEIEGLTYFDTTRTTTMASLFRNAPSFVSLDLSSFNTSSVIDMSRLLTNTISLSELILGADFRFAANAGLPLIPITDEFTGRWVNGNDVFTSAQLMAQPNIVTGTWVWQRWEEVADLCEMITYGQFANQSAAQGGLAGSAWRLCEDGTLEIDEGFINWNIYLGPWHMYREKIIRIEINGPVTAGTALRSLFRDLTQATEITGLTYFDTTGTITMASLFRNASSFVSIDLSSFNASMITDMSRLLTNTTALRALTLGEDFRFVGTHVGLPPGTWQNGNEIFTSAELMTQYNGATMSGTWTWQPVQ